LTLGAGSVFDGMATDSLSGIQLEEWMELLLNEARGVGKILEVKLCKLELIHKEVERKRSKQDSKSKIMGLDSEIRILDARLAEFELKANNKARLVSKKANNAGLLLKEEKFRRQMQSKFSVKLERLNAWLKEWEEREGGEFEMSVLSEEVRELMCGVGQGERTAFMHLRTTSGSVRGRVSGGEKEAVKEKGAMKEKEKEAVKEKEMEKEKEKEAAKGKVKVKVKEVKTEKAESKRKEFLEVKMKPPASYNNENNCNSNTNKEEVVGEGEGKGGKFESPPRRKSTRNRKSTLLPFGTLLTPGKPPRKEP